MITKVSPTKIRLDGFDSREVELRKLLTYTDKGAQFELTRHKNAHWFINKFGEEIWKEKLDELKALVSPCLLEVGKDGHFYTYSGLIKLILEKWPEEEVKDEVKYPKLDFFVYSKQPPNLRSYQRAAVDLLKSNLHASINHATGSGKTRTMIQLIKEMGLWTVVVVPSKSIANQMYDLFVEYFGKSRVGMFGDNKRELLKTITVAIGKSVCNVKPNTKEWAFFQETKLFLADECHLLGADTLQNICFGVLANAPYRFFFSGSPVRNDGRDMVLDGIIGPVVHEYTVEDGVRDGVLAKPNFVIVKTESESKYYNKDPLKMIYHHFYNNANLHKQAALLANQAYLKEHAVLIMVDKIEQFKYMAPYLPDGVKFAHSGASAEIKEMIVERYHKSDVKRLVKDFNDGTIRYMVGTGVIGIGTDIRPVRTIINLQAGKSEAKFRQLVGRGTRKVPGKEEFNFIDFDLVSIPSLHKQTEERIKIYQSIYPNSIKFL